ncbi:MAG: hypothetical protein ACFCUV_21690 [Rivularia sp. (in: cyanobacteria)]
MSLRATAKQSQSVAVASFHFVPLAMTNAQLILPKYLRDLLLDAVLLTESTKLLRKLSEYVAQRAGLPVEEFTAMLVNPELAVDDSSGVLIRPFAQVTAPGFEKVWWQIYRIS